MITGVFALFLPQKFQNRDSRYITATTSSTGYNIIIRLDKALNVFEVITFIENHFNIWVFKLFQGLKIFKVFYLVLFSVMSFFKYKTSKYSKAKVFGIWDTQYTLLLCIENSIIVITYKIQTNPIHRYEELHNTKDVILDKFLEKAIRKFWFVRSYIPKLSFKCVLTIR